MCDPVLSAPPILLPPVLLGSSLNPMVVPFPSESLLDPTADSFHPPPPTSLHVPPRPVPTPLASPNIPSVASLPESQHDELNSSLPVQHDELAPPVIQHDELDDLIQASVMQFLSSDNWTNFVESARDPKSDWADDISSLDHPAAELLSYYKEAGVPVVPTPESIPWNQGKRDAALARGCNKSALEHIEFLRTEFTDMIKQKQWVLLPADLVMDQPDLQLSPLGVVTQRDRRPRTISDYSYYLINADTSKLAPQTAMQFGKALNRILQQIQTANPRYGPIYMSKIDVADTFYRINLNPTDSIQMGVLFPTKKGERMLIGFPLVLPMGWAESPPAFCAGTETIADLANSTLVTNMQSLDIPHRLDTISETVSESEIISAKFSTVAVVVDSVDSVKGSSQSPKMTSPVPRSEIIPRSEIMTSPNIPRPKIIPRSEIIP